MELNLRIYLIVCPLVFLAGMVDAIGGGGGLISLPAYLMAGLPPHMAAATNKLSACIGTFASAARYLKSRCTDLATALPGIPAALIGAQFGARFALKIPDEIFRYVMLALLPVIALYVLLHKEKPPREGGARSRLGHMAAAFAIALVIGFYDGFYGPGTGTFLILAYTGILRLEARKAGGSAKLINLSSNLASLTVFLKSDTVLIPLGLTAAAFSLAGHYIGAGIAIRKGSRLIRTVILGVIGLLFIKVIYDLVRGGAV